MAVSNDQDLMPDLTSKAAWQKHGLLCVAVLRELDPIHATRPIMASLDRGSIHRYVMAKSVIMFTGFASLCALVCL